MAVVEGTALEPRPAVEHDALRPRLGDGALVALDRALVDHGAEEHVAFGGIAHPHRADALQQALGERRRDVAVHVDPARRAALLVLEAERRAHDAFSRRVEIRAGHDDRRVLAAELEQAGLDQAGAEAGVDPHAHGLGAGEHDAIHAGMLPERIADGVTMTDEQVEHARWQSRIPVHLVQAEAGQGVSSAGL